MSGRDSIEPERVSGVRLAILLLVALAGAAGWLAFAGAAGLAHPAQGAFWSVRDADDRVLPLAADGAGLPLHPGQIFWLDAGEGAARRYTGLSLRLAPGGGQSAYADLRFGEAGASNFRFVFVPSQPPTAYLGSREGEGPWVELAHAQLAGPSADPRAPCDLGLRLLPDAIETTWNGRPLLRAPTPAPPLASRVALWTDDARLLSVRAEGEESDGPFDASSDGARDGSRAVTRDDPSDGQRDTRRDGQSARRAAAIRSFARTEDFTTLAGDALRRQRGLAGLALAGAVALAALYLRSRCTRAPPPARLALATLLLLAPAGLPFAVHALAPLPGLDPRAAAAFLALPGLLLALRSLRAFVRVDVPRAGLDIPRAGLDVPRAGLADRGRGALVVLALLGATAFAASGAAGARADRALREAQAWLPRLDATPYALDAPRTLDAGNALAIPGVRRDLDLAARVTLSGDGLLEVRLRSADDQPVAGLALCLRAGDAAQSGFFVENSFEFRRAGNARVAAPADVPFELELRLRGDRAEAAIDGVPVADATCDEFPAGGSFVLAAAGSARVERLELRPVAGGGAVPRPERARALAALGAVVLLALLAAAARVLFRQSWPEALPTVAFVLAPLALGLHAADGDGRLTLLAAGAACAGAALLALLHAPSLGLAAGAARTGVFTALAAAACAGALWSGADLAPRAPPVDSVRPHVFPGPRLPPDLLAFEHPALRRLNGWLREHRFRGRSFAMEKPAGALRVLAVGSSSTWGHGVPEESGLDYPTQLQALLRGTLPELPLEVINGGIPGSSSARSLRFFREVLLRFQPDVVTVSFAFNDAYHVTQLDEDPFLERTTRPDYDHAAAQAAEAEEVFDGKLRLNRLLALFAEHPGPTLPLWEQVLAEEGAARGPSAAGTARGSSAPGAAAERTPPERFASNLRAFARLCAERDVRLVLVKEPFRDDPPRIWKDEFYAAIDAVGREFSLPVVDPRRALAAQGGAALFLDEIHPAPAGHAVIARSLLPIVAALLQERAAERH